MVTAKRIRTNRSSAALCALPLATCVVVLAAPSLAWADGPVQSGVVVFDAPGAGGTANDQCWFDPVGTTAVSINATGTIVGYFVDESCDRHGFVRAPDGQLTEFDVPGAATQGIFTTSPAAINAAGVVAGSYTDTRQVARGFIRSADGVFTTFDAPGAGTGPFAGTHVWGINNAGEVVGYYIDDSLVRHGFVRSPGGQFTVFDADRGGTGLLQGTAAFAVNARGTVVGCAVHGPNGTFAFTPFLRTPDGTITYLDTAPDGSTVRCPSDPASINSAGTLAGDVGAYDQASPEGYHNYAFLRTAQGTYTTFDAVATPFSPCCTDTFAAAINDRGQVVGDEVDPNGVSHGFVRDAGGAIALFDVPAAGTADGEGTFPTDINASGEVIGTYKNADGVIHGFVRQS
jgi:uncharacterized membrane protein